MAKVVDEVYVATCDNEIKEYARKLIDIVGKDGGFIMSSNTVLDDADPERVRVWMDFTREYGVY